MVLILSVYTYEYCTLCIYLAVVFPYPMGAGCYMMRKVKREGVCSNLWRRSRPILLKLGFNSNHRSIFWLGSSFLESDLEELLGNWCCVVLDRTMCLDHNRKEVDYK